MFQLNKCEALRLDKLKKKRLYELKSMGMGAKVKTMYPRELVTKFKVIYNVVSNNFYFN